MYVLRYLIYRIEHADVNVDKYGAKKLSSIAIYYVYIFYYLIILWLQEFFTVKVFA